MAHSPPAEPDGTLTSSRYYRNFMAPTKVRYSVQNSPLPARIEPDESNPHTPALFPQYSCHINLTTTNTSSLQAFKKTVCIYHLPVCTASPAHPFLLHLLFLLTFGEEHKLWTSSWCSSFAACGDFSHLLPKHSPMHAVLKHHRSVTPYRHRPSSRNIQNNG